MIITLNQKEIEKMILTGLSDMGIQHEGATITMVAGRSPSGMTAEIKLESVSRPQVTPEPPIHADTPPEPDEPEEMIDPTKPLFGKAALK